MRRKSTIDQIDEFFDSKSSSEQQVIYAVIVLLILALIWFVVFPMSQSYFDTQKSNLDSVTTKLNATNSYLSSIRNGAAVQDEERKLGNEKKMLQGLKGLNSYFDNKLREVSQLTYSEKNWALFLDSLTTMANESNVKILSLQSQQKEPTRQKVEAVLNINVRFQGTFNNVLKYINSIEQSAMVVDVNGLDINSTSGGLNGDMKIAVWGMKY